MMQAAPQHIEESAGYRKKLIFLFAAVLASRIPFLWAGFGSEEDAWLLPVTARHIALSGIYEMSRAPGHPLQELLYAILYNGSANPFLTNFISAFSSAIAAVLLTVSFKNLGVQHYLFAGFAFAFTPVVFIASTYTIDYLPAMAWAMGSMFVITSCRNSTWSSPAWAGILLGIATGFRLTSLAMVLPLGMILWHLTGKNYRSIFIFWIASGLSAIASYWPVLQTYGTEFFTYADQFPYPNIFKTTYKATLGVFGLIGAAAISWFKWKIWIGRFRSGNIRWPDSLPRPIALACYAAFLLYIIAYLRLPQKSAYFIPIVPFLILIFSYHLSSVAFRMLCVLMTLSCFLFSINLTDPLRGSEYSPASFTFRLAGQEIFVDPLTGPVYADYTKRLKKTAYVKEVRTQLDSDTGKIVLIAGWWYNQLSVGYWKSGDTTRTMTPNGHINYIRPGLVLAYYIDRPTMEKFIADGYEIFYLPEQDLYNDQYSAIQYTNTVAKAY